MIRPAARRYIQQLANHHGVDLGSVTGTGPGDRTPAQDLRGADAVTRPASRYIQQMAREQGVDLSTVAGTGVGGRICVQDIRQAAVDHLQSSARRPATTSRATFTRPAAQILGPGYRPAVSAELAFENSKAEAPRDVRQLADGLGVRLSRVKGTGAGGQVTRLDVEQEADRNLARSRHVTDVAVTATGQRVATKAQASTKATPLPTMTASGIDPKQLLQVPDPVRPAMAAAPTTSEAYRIAQKYAGMTDDDARMHLQVDQSISTEHGGGQGAWYMDPKNAGGVDFEVG